MKRPVRVFVSAGEVSGDNILGAVLARLRTSLPEMELAGLGGPRAEAAGLRPLFPMAATAFSGVWDVAVRLPFALRLFRAAARALRDFRPDLVLLVDYPGLNLRLARLARSLGTPVHFIAPPQAWAYRNPEAKLARARAALAGCSVQPLYAFEADAWRVPGIEVVQGHFQNLHPSRPGFRTHSPDTVSPGLPRIGLTPPLRTDSRSPSRNHSREPRPEVSPELPRNGRALLCPGSRLPVLRRNLPAWLRLLDAAGLSTTPDGGTPFDVLVPPFLAGEAARLIERYKTREARGMKRTEGTGETEEAGKTEEAGRVEEAGRTEETGRPGPRVRTDAEAAMAQAPLAIAFPGTLTLELALHRVPTVVLALLDPLTYRIGRRALAGRRLALPNLILGEDLFPEWAGTPPGPSVAEFRALWEGLRDGSRGGLGNEQGDGPPQAADAKWDRRLAALAARMGPGNGAEVAAEACLQLVR